VYSTYKYPNYRAFARVHVHVVEQKPQKNALMI